MNQLFCCFSRFPWPVLDSLPHTRLSCKLFNVGLFWELLRADKAHCYRAKDFELSWGRLEEFMCCIAWLHCLYCLLLCISVSVTAYGLMYVCMCVYICVLVCVTVNIRDTNSLQIHQSIYGSIYLWINLFLSFLLSINKTLFKSDSFSSANS